MARSFQQDREGRNVVALVRVLAVVGGGVAIALAGYTADEARIIIGLKSKEIANALGYPGRAAMAHRDDMVLWD